MIVLIALTLKGSCVQTLGQTKKASHFEVDLETKQKKGHHLARNGIRVRQQTIFMNIMRFLSAKTTTTHTRAADKLNHLLSNIFVSFLTFSFSNDLCLTSKV